MLFGHYIGLPMKSSGATPSVPMKSSLGATPSWARLCCPLEDSGTRRKDPSSTYHVLRTTYHLPSLHIHIPHRAERLEPWCDPRGIADGDDRHRGGVEMTAGDLEESVGCQLLDHRGKTRIVVVGQIVQRDRSDEAGDLSRRLDLQRLR